MSSNKRVISEEDEKNSFFHLAVTGGVHFSEMFSLPYDHLTLCVMFIMRKCDVKAFMTILSKYNYNAIIVNNNNDLVCAEAHHSISNL